MMKMQSIRTFFITAFFTLKFERLDQLAIFFRILRPFYFSFLGVSG